MGIITQNTRSGNRTKAAPLVLSLPRSKTGPPSIDSHRYAIKLTHCSWVSWSFSWFRTEVSGHLGQGGFVPGSRGCLAPVYCCCRQHSAQYSVRSETTV